MLTILLLVVNLNPDNSSISTYANKIANATVTCTSLEISQLVVLKTQVDELAANINLQLTAVQATIEGNCLRLI